MLTRLSGGGHRVYTGYAVRCMEARRRFSGVSMTEVFFKHLSGPEIDWYIGTGEPFDKAGGYAIQGCGMSLVKKINGSYTNVVGLPVL